MNDEFQSSQRDIYTPWPIIMRRLSHVFTVVLCLSLTRCLSQRADFVPGPLQLNRRFSWSTEAPLTKAINELAPDAIPHIGLLIRHATRVEKAVLESLKRPKIMLDEIVQPCDPHIKKLYRRSIFRGFGVRGFLEPAWNCGSDVSGEKMHTGDIPGYTLDDLYDAAFNRGRTIKRRVNEIALRLIDNFSRPEMPFNFTYDTVSANCALTSVCIYRVGEHWHQGLGIHSNGKSEHVRDGFQQSILEYFRVVDGKLGDNLLLRLPVYDDGTIERVILDNTTTMIQSWRQTPNPSCFNMIRIEDNPAIVEALDHADHSAQQAEDAVASSNLAILLLPLGLNLVPIALFADVSTTMMLLYTLMSDVLTVIPLAIKGVELVLIRAQRYRAVVTRVTSPFYGNFTIPLASGGEIWAAECRIREEVGRTGVILTVMALIFLCIGIGGEFAARSYARKRKGRLGRLDEWWKWKSRSVDTEELDSELLSVSGGNSLPHTSQETGRLTLDNEVGADGVELWYSFEPKQSDPIH